MKTALPSGWWMFSGTLASTTSPFWVKLTRYLPKSCSNSLSSMPLGPGLSRLARLPNEVHPHRRKVQSEEKGGHYRRQGLGYGQREAGMEGLESHHHQQEGNQAQEQKDRHQKKAPDKGTLTGPKHTPGLPEALPQALPGS